MKSHIFKSISFLLVLCRPTCFNTERALNHALNDCLTTSLKWNSWNSSVPKKCLKTLKEFYQCRISIPVTLQMNANYTVFPFFISLMAESYLGGQFRFKWGGKRHREEIAQGEKCEPLAPVAAQSERLPMWKGLTVNSPLRWAWSRGNASQSPACSPTWEQLQPPSASSSWRLPEGSASHPSSFKSEVPLLRQRGFSLFDEISENPSLVCIQYMRARLYCWNAHWHRKKKEKKNTVSTFFYTLQRLS